VCGSFWGGLKKFPILIFLAYLVPLDVDVPENITAKLFEDLSEFNIFCTLVTMATAAILNFFNPPQKLPHTTVDILQSFMKFDERNPIFFKSHIVGIFTVVCGSFWRVDKIQNGITMVPK
jgi:hypothetical protein